MSDNLPNLVIYCYTYAPETEISVQLQTNR